jgi:hypothetical protein
MKIKIIYFILLLLPQLVYSQRDINSVLDNTLNFRGLTRQDITIPIDFFGAAEKSPTNDAKLIMPLVRDMMINPLRSMTWLDSTGNYLKLDAERLIQTFYNKYYGFDIPTLAVDFIYIETSEDEFGDGFVNNIKSKNVRNRSLYNLYKPEEIKFLNDNLLSILEESDNEDPGNFDIFKYNKMRDSSIETSRRTMELLSKAGIEPRYFDDFYWWNLIYFELKYFNYSKNWSTYHIDEKNASGDFYYYYDEDGIRIAVGGPGKNIYSGRFDLIIDFGGDDVYNIENNNLPISKNGQGSFSCIIDLAGNDFYSSKSNFSLAGALFSSSFIFDKQGDDTYEGKTGCLGAAIGGLGVLLDESGNDTYRAESFSIGAGCFGMGLLIDRSGNDFYIANSYSQGFGFTQGVGCIIDNKGNDDYLVDSRSLDIGRYNDHYISMCQGYGLGLRPFYAGGIGLILEGEGNDIYHTDIFGQGGAYWYSLGAIIDKSGHDKYDSYQYAQGAGIHLAIGLLKDYDGWDFYTSDGVSQGCGHDFGFGLLWDVKGNDNYSAYSLSQGAGNANGIGMLVDESGIDGYLVKDFNNTRGYGNPRREYGSIGVFIDGSGEDAYSVKADSILINTSTWGVRNDFTDIDLPGQVSGDNFKVDLDETRIPPTVSKGSTAIEEITENYFIMAKTIEPRFSLWQEYGFKKLVEDSINTAIHLTTKLSTSDHRETQVMRVLARKIPYAINDALIFKLMTYIRDKRMMTQPEVSLAAYVIGETGLSIGKQILYELTFDDNVRIRSSAVNALGKIPYDVNDTDFNSRVTERLRELVLEDRPEKLYNKDLAYAFTKYYDEKNIPALEKLAQNIFFGARFLALEELKKYNR